MFLHLFRRASGNAAPTPAADNALLSHVGVASPCHASWDEMAGGDRVRSCEHCRKKVYNLSELTAAEAAKLVRESEGKSICVRFYRRPDGTMLTQDCPVGLRRVRQRVARATAAVFGSILFAGSVFSPPSRFVQSLIRRMNPPVPPRGDRAPHIPSEPRVTPPSPVSPSDPGLRMGDMVVAPAPIMGKIAAPPQAPRRVDLPMAATPHPDPTVSLR